MAETIFKLINREVDTTDSVYKDLYNTWRKYNTRKREPFLSIFKGFKEKHLNGIEGGPLKLYVYIGLHADNDDGTCWHSIATMADFFGTKSRTIDNWLKSLVERNLIYRERNGHRSHTTYLVPYSTTFRTLSPSQVYDMEDQKLVDNLLTGLNNRKHVYGDIQAVYHLFQWGVHKKKAIPKGNLQWLLVLTKRGDVLTAHHYAFSSLNSYGVNRVDFDSVVRFESPFKFQKEPIIGLALSYESRIDQEPKGLADILGQLNEAKREDLERLQRVDYGEIPDGLFDEDAEPQ